MGLTEVPSELFRMKNVKELWLGSNNLCSLPSEIAQLETLETLIVRLSKRSDHDLTESHGCFQVAYNQLTSLPPELGLLTSLKWLKVRQSRQTDHDLTHLSRFQVGDNQLTSLPAEIGQLAQLQWLDVRNSN
jgi:Leucine-rich repeat (LRR) protein